MAPTIKTGKAAVDTNAIYQPLQYPTANPPIVMKILMKYVGTFSPSAP